MTDIPEDIINQYPFDANTKQVQLLKVYLIHHFNTLTLQHLKKHQVIMSKNDIMVLLPNKIIDYYSTSKGEKKTNEKKEKKKEFWSDDDDQLAMFKTFIHTHYRTSEIPDVKFKDLMLAYNLDTEQSVPTSWSAKYASLFTTLNIKFDKIVSPKFAHQGGGGTCYVFLQPRITKTRHIEKKNDTLTIPDVNTIPYIPIPK